MLPGHAAHKIVCDQADVAITRPNRRQTHGHHFQTVEQVNEKLTLTDPILQIQIGRGDDANIISCGWETK
jgi:hypothetical protein